MRIFWILCCVIVSASTFFEYDDKNLMNKMEVKVGEKFWISFRSNPTTGYRWERISELDKLEKEAQDIEGVFQGNDNIESGIGGKQIFSFTAKSTGKEIVKFAYKRPWTDADSTIAEIIINIS